ncbi:MAG: hypothetical protein ACLTZM_08775 [Ruminococcus sp.]
MQEGKADKERYAQDKPKNCAYCYFWSVGKKACTKKAAIICSRSRKQRKRRGTAKAARMESIPRGIGYCLAKILWEMKESHGK